MRIRKQFGKGCVGVPPGGDPLSIVSKRGDWNGQKSSEMDNEGTLMMEQCGLDGQYANGKQQPIAALAVQEGHGSEQVEVAKPDSQHRPLQESDSRGFHVVDELSVLTDQEEPQQQGKILQGRKGCKRSPMDGSELSHLVSKTKGNVVREHSSSLPLDKVHQTMSMKVPESACLGKTTQEDDTTTRHYVRRSLRKDGDGSSQEQSEKHFADGVVASAARVRKTESDAVNQYKSVQIPNPSPEEKQPPLGVTSESKLPKAEPWDSSEDQDNPCRAPEGSLLHSLYLQLLAAGRSGVTLTELFGSFIRGTSLQGLASNWREQVQAHLESNPYFEEMEGRYLVCEALVQPTSKYAVKCNVIPIVSNPYDMGVTPKRADGKPSPKIDLLQFDSAAGPDAHPDSSCNLSNDKHEGIQTRRKAYQKTIEAVLNESVVEFQKMQRDTENGDRSGGTKTVALKLSGPLESATAEPIETQPQPAPLRVSKKRKSLDEEEEVLPRNIRFGGAIPGSLKAMQAKIVAETGVQKGVRCARKDGSNDSSKWQCPMMAIEGHSLCEHHKILSERKKARYAKRKKQGESKERQSLHRTLKPDTRVSRKRLKGDDQIMPIPGAGMCKSGSEDFTKVDEVVTQSLLNMRSDVPVGNFQLETRTIVDHMEIEGKSMNKKSKRLSEKLVPPSFESASYVAAKKTAAKSPYVAGRDKSKEKQSVSLTRPPTIPPLPAMYGVRRKAVKNRSLLSF